jgi:NMD protein affecting ribosome stability and mRNA decay
VPDFHPGIEKMCRHCGAMDAARLGLCSVCSLSVCEKCGNVQHVRGEKRVTHNSCLKDDEGGFSMIKFVR